MIAFGFLFFYRQSLYASTSTNGNTCILTIDISLTSGLCLLLELSCESFPYIAEDQVARQTSVDLRLTT